MNLNTLENKIDELAQAVVNGFNRVEERFNGIENRLDSIEARLDRIEQRLDRLEQRVNALENRMDQVVDDIRILKTSVARIEEHILADHAQRLQRLEKQLAS